MNKLHWLLIATAILIGIMTAVHALLYKRDPRSAFVWMALSLLYPPIGSFLYFMFGINRVRVRAKKLKRRAMFYIPMDYEMVEDDRTSPIDDVNIPHEFKETARISGSVTRRPLVAENHIRMFENGEQAYPAMLDAIQKAERSVYLSTYIFATDTTGRSFIETLAMAARRGVDVRVMIDGMGEIYSLPRAGGLLKKHGVRFSRFIPPKLIPPTVNINLRNHRKVLAVDGTTGFVGGMNISDRHLVGNDKNPNRIVDMHFCLKGPVVSQVEHVFLKDWAFSSGEHILQTSAEKVHAGNMICRTIVDGPDEDLDKLATIIISTVSTARKRILIVTPYFIPPRELVYALEGAALRGVEVDILLPEKSNLPFVDWATRKMLWQLLQRDVRIYYQPPPFAHTKLFIVDDYYVQIGSANIDPRSFRLNFELAVEVFDKKFVGSLSDYLKLKCDKSRRVSLEEMESRPLHVRARDAFAWLFSPYL